MNVAYVEDDIKQRDYISMLLRSCLKEAHISVDSFEYYSSKEEFLSAWHPKKYDLVLLDIFLDKDLGLDIAKEIRRTDRDTRIVFCSSSNEFASESYELRAAYYLTKPVTRHSMSKMVGHLAKDLGAAMDYICLDDGQRVVLSEVIYTNYYNHCITIHLRNKDCIRTWTSQKDFTKLIESFAYMLPINPGNIINLNEVVSFEKGSFMMSDETLLHASRSRKRAISEAYKSFIFSELDKG